VWLVLYVMSTVGPGQSPFIPSLSHLLLYLLLIPFPFLTRFIYFLAFPSVCGFGDILADKQTDTHAQTYSSQYFATTLAGKLKTNSILLFTYLLEIVGCCIVNSGNLRQF